MYMHFLSFFHFDLIRNLEFSPLRDKNIPKLHIQWGIQHPMLWLLWHRHQMVQIYLTKVKWFYVVFCLGYLYTFYNTTTIFSEGNWFKFLVCTCLTCWHPIAQLTYSKDQCIAHTLSGIIGSQIYITDLGWMPPLRLVRMMTDNKHSSLLGIWLSIYENCYVTYMNQLCKVENECPFTLKMNKIQENILLHCIDCFFCI